MNNFHTAFYHILRIMSTYFPKNAGKNFASFYSKRLEKPGATAAFSGSITASILFEKSDKAYYNGKDASFAPRLRGEKRRKKVKSK